MSNEVKTIRQQVLQVVAKTAGIPEAKSENTLEQHGLDSMDRVEFVMDLEDAFGLEISDEDAQRLYAQPVQEWVQYIEARRAAATA